MSIEPLSHAEARAIAEQAQATRDVLVLHRVGATAYLRFTPYENHRGTTVNMWSCITTQLEPMPERTLLTMATIVRPWAHDDWEINQIHTPWVVARLMEQPAAKVDVVPAETTPFAGEMLRWDGDQA